MPRLLGTMNVNRLRILVADDHGLMRRGAREILHSRRGWKVVAEAANGREAVEKARELKPDVAIVDLSMPELDGVELIRQIRKAAPDTKVLVLTMHESDHMIREALDVGARGYLLKSDFADCLLKAVRAITEGKCFLTPKVWEIVMQGFLRARSQHPHRERAGARTTPREIEIIHLLAGGKSNKEIAAQLGISVRTVETHKAKIMLKLGFHSLAELVHYALRQRIISAPAPKDIPAAGSD
jgi:DNA-binding NarL/FixJ family response regulator